MTTVYLVQLRPGYGDTETLYSTCSRERAMFFLAKERVADNDLADFLQITEIVVDGAREDEAESMYSVGYQCWSGSMDYKGTVFHLEKEMNTSAVTLPLFFMFPMYYGKGDGSHTLRIGCHCWAKDRAEAVAIMDKERIRRISEGEWKE